MLVKTIRKPGENGTKKLVARYGRRLVCVRYRYDPLLRKRYKTVELIVEEGDWLPPQEPESLPDPPSAPSRRIAVRIAYHERDLREKVKAAGGTWSQRERLWRVTPETVERLGLQSRIAR